MTIIMKFI